MAVMNLVILASEPPPPPPSLERVKHRQSTYQCNIKMLGNLKVSMLDSKNTNLITVLCRYGIFKGIPRHLRKKSS